jgi:hypothetical protein
MRSSANVIIGIKTILLQFSDISLPDFDFPTKITNPKEVISSPDY